MDFGQSWSELRINEGVGTFLSFKTKQKNNFRNLMVLQPFIKLVTSLMRLYRYIPLPPELYYTSLYKCVAICDFIFRHQENITVYATFVLMTLGRILLTTNNTHVTKTLHLVSLRYTRKSRNNIIVRLI